MSERRIRFSVVTDDLQRSEALYRVCFGLRMRQLSNPILMFPLDPLGIAEFEVCLREASRDLLEFDFGAKRTTGLLVSLRFDSEAEMNSVAESALNIGAQVVGQSLSLSWNLEDFNGVNWFLSIV